MLATLKSNNRSNYILIQITSTYLLCCVRCEIIVSQFLNMDLDNDDVGAFLKDFVLPTTNELV